MSSTRSYSYAKGSLLVILMSVDVYQSNSFSLRWVVWTNITMVKGSTI